MLNVLIIGSDKDRSLVRKIRSTASAEMLHLQLLNGLGAGEADTALAGSQLLILTDHALDTYPRGPSELIVELSTLYPSLPVILLLRDEKKAAPALSAGVGLLHIFRRRSDLSGTISIIRSMLRSVRSSADSQRGQDGLSGGPAKRMVGRSSAIRKVFNDIRKAAESDIPVLILGETGTGKDLAAYSIHNLSARKDRAYIPVNLGAWPSELVASELFGHEKGAFTGALKQHKGVFEQGDKGSVFLDEIDTLDDKMQVSLLRLLEQKRFKRLGGVRNLHSSARLIAASNEDLDALVEAGRFRNDLFYRMDVFRIQLPPLRERKADIPILAMATLNGLNSSYERNIEGFSSEAMQALLSFHWPGNIRELKNVIQRAGLECRSGKIQLQDLPPRFRQESYSEKSLLIPAGSTLLEAERELILHTLALCANNRSEAARRLGISRRALYNKLEKHHLN